MHEIRYRAEIDGLRAIAVSAVVLYHAFGAPSAGYVGVDVFFVISGYLISALLLKELGRSGRIEIAAFYGRRIRRIVPAALLVCIGVLIVAPHLLPPQELIHAAQSAAASTLFLANVFFFARSGGYFDSSSEQMPLLHFWSLAVEEQFYLVWPLLLLLVVRRWPRYVAGILVGFGLTSLLVAEALMQIDPAAAFYQAPARFWELAAGGAIAAAHPLRMPRGTASVGAVLVAAACSLPLAHFPASGALPAVAATALILAAVNGSHDAVASRLLATPPLVAIGRISYSLYLWHWPLLAFYRASSVGAPDPRANMLLVGVAVLLAAASYRYVETPFRRGRTPAWRTVTSGAAASCVLALACVGYANWVERREAERPTDNPLALRTEADLPRDWRRCHYQVWSTDFPRQGCESSPGSAPSIVQWGDSMAMSWRPFAWELARRTQAVAIDYSRDACPPFVGYVPSEASPGDLKCRDWNAQVLERAKGADTVILAARWHGAFGAHLRATLAQLAPTVRRILIIGPTPQMRDAVPRCIRAHALQSCAVQRAEFERDAHVLGDEIARAAQSFDNVSIIDPSDFFCDNESCPPLRDGYALYRDAYHVTATAASAFSARWLQRPDASTR